MSLTRAACLLSLIALPSCAGDRPEAMAASPAALELYEQGVVHQERRAGRADADSAVIRFQAAVDEVQSGLECGVRVGEYREYQEGDVIECYTLEKLEVSL